MISIDLLWKYVFQSGFILTFILLFLYLLKGRILKFIDTLIAKSVEHTLDLNLEKYKHELSLILKKYEFDFQGQQNRSQRGIQLFLVIAEKRLNALQAAYKWVRNSQASVLYDQKRCKELGYKDLGIAYDELVANHFVYLPRDVFKNINECMSIAHNVRQANIRYLKDTANEKKYREYKEMKKTFDRVIMNIIDSIRNSYDISKIIDEIEMKNQKYQLSDLIFDRE